VGSPDWSTRASPTHPHLIGDVYHVSIWLMGQQEQRALIYCFPPTADQAPWQGPVEGTTRKVEVADTTRKVEGGGVHDTEGRGILGSEIK